jgi:hypothetical protein
MKPDSQHNCRYNALIVFLLSQSNDQNYFYAWKNKNKKQILLDSGERRRNGWSNVLHPSNDYRKIIL